MPMKPTSMPLIERIKMLLPIPHWLPATLLPLLSLAAPMLLGQAGQVLLQLVDTIMVGRVSATALGGAAVAGNLVMFGLYFAYGSLGAVAPKVAQAFSAYHQGTVREPAVIGRLVTSGSWLGAGIGIFLALVLTGITPLLGFLGQPPDVIEETGPYLLLIAWSLPWAMVSLVLGQSAEAMNRPWPVFIILGGTVLLNVALNALFIFGYAGFPAMGLTGAGLATLIARVAQVAALLLWLHWDRSWLRWELGTAPLRAWRLEGRELLREGLPIAGQDVLEGGSFALGTLMLGWISTAALAANQITIVIASLASMFPYALATATSVKVAHAIGCGDRQAARRSGVAGVALGVILMTGCTAIYLTVGPWLATFFTDDPEVLALSATLILIAGFYQISDAIQSISLGALRGMLDNRVPLIANAICYWGLSLPTVYLLTFSFGWGAIGVWVGYLPWMLLTGCFFLVRFWRQTRSPHQFPREC
jgi:multidrug resistance protein, MATE family